jgi:hypothetical protein
MKKNSFYFLGVISMVVITYLSVVSIKQYSFYDTNYKKWQNAENAWQKIQRNSLTPKEWGDLKITSEINNSIESEKRVRRTLTVFNKHYLQKKYLETNAGNVIVKSIDWRDVLSENYVGFESIKKDIQLNLNFYSKIKRQLKKNSDLSVVNKSLSKRKFDQTLMKLIITFVLISLMSAGYHYLYSEKYFYRKISSSPNEKKLNVEVNEISEMSAWSFGDLVDDFCHEVRLKCHGAEVLLKVDPIYVDRKTYENFELALKSLVKITEFLHMKRCVRLHVSVWNSNDKVYLFADFLGVHLEQEMASNGHLANKLLQMENLMAPHNAIVKLLSFGNKNKTRLVLNFNPSLHGRKRVEITQQSA